MLGELGRWLTWSTFGDTKTEQGWLESIERVRGAATDGIEARELGSSGLTYIRDQLNYPKVFASHLLKLPLERGVVGFSPPDIPEEQRLDLSGDYSWGRDFWDGVDKLTVESVLEHFHKTEEAPYAIVVDPYGLRSDPWLQKRMPPPHFFHGEELYFFLDRAEADFDRTYRALHFCHEYPSIVAATSLPSSNAPLQAGNDLGVEMLSLLARRTRRILIGAHDALGYISWRAPAA